MNCSNTHYLVMMLLFWNACGLPDTCFLVIGRNVLEKSSPELNVLLRVFCTTSVSMNRRPFLWLCLDKHGSRCMAWGWLHKAACPVWPPHPPTRFTERLYSSCTAPGDQGLIQTSASSAGSLRSLALRLAAEGDSPSERLGGSGAWRGWWRGLWSWGAFRLSAHDGYLAHWWQEPAKAEHTRLQITSLQLQKIQNILRVISFHSCRAHGLHSVQGVLCLTSPLKSVE